MSNIIQKYINNIVQKYSNGTALIKGATLGAWDNPDKRLVMAIGADANGIHFKNDPNDPMPIKTINMNGLQVWEETDDYYIYVDKDAVITTVQNYVPGTFDLYNERKTLIEAHMEMLKMYEVEWTPEDSEKLLLDINNEQLERIASTPTTMDEPTEIQTFSARAIPTTYECCFRTDKKTGEIYIGEGYENLLVTKGISNSNYEINQNVKENTITYTSINSYTQNSSLKLIGSDTRIVDCFFSLDILKNTSNIAVSPSGYSAFHPPIGKHERIITNTNGWNHAVSLFAWGTDVFTEVQAGEQLVIKKAMVVNSLAPKPFVRGVMPGGKLAFVTGATSETHSFVGKCFNSNELSDRLYPHYANLSGSGVYGEYFDIRIGLYPREPVDYVCSDLFSGFGRGGVYEQFSIANKAQTENNLRLHRYAYGGVVTFKQLLIYKGNLTESELKAENAKVINVSKLDFNPLSIKRYLSNLEQFEKVQIYSPALTDEEIAVELGKNVFIPKNRDGVPSWQPKIGV